MQYNSLIYDDIDFSQYGRIEYVDRPLLPQIDLQTREILGLDGVLYGDSSLSPINIEIGLRVFDYRALDTVLNEIAGKLYKKELKPLNYTLKDTRYDAVLSDLKVEERHRSQRALVVINFFIPYPIARTKTRIETDSFTEHQFFLYGNFPTFPIFEFTGKANKITNMRTGESLNILDGNQYNFVIDCDKQTVRDKDINLMSRLKRDSEFFFIQDGDRIKATAPTKASYYERFLYDVKGW